MVVNAGLLSAYAWLPFLATPRRRSARLLFVRGERLASPQPVAWSSWLNGRHMAFAWSSLVWVALTDLYVYLVSTGTIRDLNTW